MAFDQKPNSEIPRFFPILSCGRMGLRGEFLGSAKFSVLQKASSHLEVWRLRLEDSDLNVKSNALHELSHLAYFLALRTTPSSETMLQMLDRIEYQANGHAEYCVVGFEHVLWRLYLKDSPNEVLGHDAIKRILKEYIDHAFNRFQQREWQGQKGAFYLGRAQGRLMHDVRADFHYADYEIFRAAGRLASDRGEDHLWFENIYDGDFYMVQHNGVSYRQYYRDPVEPKYDPDFEVIVDRLAMVLHEMQPRLDCDLDDEEVSELITMADVYEMVLKSPSVGGRRDPYFEARFYGREEVSSASTEPEVVIL